MNGLRQRAWLPAAFAIMMFVAAFRTGVASGVSTSFSHLAPSIVGAAAAISSQVFGLKGHPYQTYDSVLNTLYASGVIPTPGNFPKNFHDYPLLTEALQKASHANIARAALTSNPSNDQGVIEYTHLAFRLFGIDVRSLYYLYFLILGVSVAAYLSVFWNDYVACAILFAAAVGLYAFMPGFLFDNVQLMSVGTPRFLSTLGIVPLVHVAFLTLRAEYVSKWKAIGTTIVQAAIISFAYAIRATSSWMVLTLLVLVALCVTAAFFRTGGGGMVSALKRRAAFALIVLAIVVSATFARTAFFIPSEDLYAHTFWHNIFMGFCISDADWATHYGAQYDSYCDDQMSFTAARLYVQSHHAPPIKTWTMHEAVVRSVIFEFVRAHPLFAARSFLVRRPLTLYRALYSYQVTLRSTVPTYMWWLVIAVCSVLGLAAATAPSRAGVGFGAAIGVLVLAFAISSDSAFLVYSDDYLICDQALLLVALSAALLIGLVVATISAVALAFGRPLRARP